MLGLGCVYGASLRVYIIKSSKRVAAETNKIQLMSRAQIWGGQMVHAFVVVVVMSRFAVVRVTINTFGQKKKVSALCTFDKGIKQCNDNNKSIFVIIKI